MSREDKNHTMMGKKKQIEWGKKKKQIEQVFSLLFFQLLRFRQHPLKKGEDISESRTHNK